MQHRRIGPLEVAAVGLGCMRMSGSGPDAHPDRDAMLATIVGAVDAGVTLLDTAAAYGWGHNEALVGEALTRMGGAAAGVVVATKGGIERRADGANVVDGTPAALAASVDASLGRLGVDAIDLLYLHRVDPDVPIEDSVGAMGAAVTAGKVRALGLCEASVDTLRRAVAEHPIAALQTEWSLWTREIEDEVLPAARELGIAVVPYSPLGRGFFTDGPHDWAALPADDFRRHNERYQGPAAEANEAVLARLRALAGELGVPIGQLALAWVLAQGDDVVPIPGTTKLPHLLENVGAAGVALTAEQVAEIDALARAQAWAGARYPDGTLLTYSTTRPRSLAAE